MYVQDTGSLKLSVVWTCSTVAAQVPCREFLSMLEVQCVQGGGSRRRE